MSSKKIACLVLLLTTFLALGRAQAAPAAGKSDDATDPVAKVQKLNRYAMQLFDDLNIALAEKSLLEALAIVEKNNLGSGPAGLATNGNLAVLYSVGLKNPDKAVFHFKKALAVKPDLKMSKQRATPETEANLARAKAEMGLGAQPATGPKPTSAAVEAAADTGLREQSPSVPPVEGGEGTPAEPAAPAATAAGEGENAEGEEEEEEVEEIDDNNPLARLENERWREHQGSKGTWWLSLGVGSGFGYAAGHGTEAFGKPPYSVTFSSGFAPALLGQAVPEVGYFIGRNTALSLAGRFQAIFPRGPKGTATGAITGLLRLLFFTEEEGKVRWYFATTVGAGEGFRFQVNAAVSNPDGSPSGLTVKDTVRGGPYVAGIGGGMLYKLTRHWRWTVDTQLLIGFTHYSGVLDLSTGGRYQF